MICTEYGQSRARVNRPIPFVIFSKKSNEQILCKESLAKNVISIHKSFWKEMKLMNSCQTPHATN